MIEMLKTSSASSSPTPNDDSYQQQQQQQHMKETLIINTCISHAEQYSGHLDTTNTEEEAEGEQVERKRRRKQGRDETVDELHLVGLLFTTLKKSVLGLGLGCSSSRSILNSNNNSGNILTKRSFGMEIGLPTNVRHVAHVTFDRFHGFLGLPVEFEPDVPRRSPSASTTVFGVSTNSMQLSFDTRGNSVPTILLLMQHRLYALGGLQAEGIFRINPDNGQEEHVREQLNRGLIPDNVDVHSLAGLIKAWFRELPTAVLDCLTPEQVMESQTEEECAKLVRLLPPTEAALLDWAVNLMADVAQFEHLNKMNARNVAMVFAPNMTHMADPLTALMHAVQVMNFLKTLIEKTLKEREDAIIDSALDFFGGDPSGGNGHHTNLQTILEENTDPTDESDKPSKPVNPTLEDEVPTENIAPYENDQTLPNNHRGDESTQGENSAETKGKGTKCSKTAKGTRKTKPKNVVQVAKSSEKAKGSSIVSSVNLRMERVEAWR